MLQKSISLCEQWKTQKWQTKKTQQNEKHWIITKVPIVCSWFLWIDAQQTASPAKKTSTFREAPACITAGTKCVETTNLNLSTSVKPLQWPFPFGCWPTGVAVSLQWVNHKFGFSQLRIWKKVSVGWHWAVMVNGREFAGDTVGRLTEWESDEVPHQLTWPAVTQPEPGKNSPAGGEVDYRVKDKGRQKKCTELLKLWWDRWEIQVGCLPGDTAGGKMPAVLLGIVECWFLFMYYLTMFPFNTS